MSLLRPILPALAGALIGGASMAASPELPEPETLAGAWTFTREPVGACRLVLSAEPVAHGYRLEPSASCTPVFGLQAIAAWRPATDGLELAGPDGLTVIFLARTAPRTYGGHDRTGAALGLSR